MTALITTSQAPATSQPARRSGVALVPGALCQYGAAVGPSDVLHVDFDRHQVGADGLYLVEAVAGGAVTWIGCRRITKTVTGGVLVDQSGTGDWMNVPSLESVGIRVAGVVERVLQ